MMTRFFGQRPAATVARTLRRASRVIAVAPQTILGGLWAASLAIGSSTVWCAANASHTVGIKSND